MNKCVERLFVGVAPEHGLELGRKIDDSGTGDGNPLAVVST